MCILNIYRRSLTSRTVKPEIVAIGGKLNMTWKLFTKFLTEEIYVSSSKDRLYFHKYSTHTPLATYATASGLLDFRIFQNYLLIINKYHGSEILFYSHVTTLHISYEFHYHPYTTIHLIQRRYPSSHTACTDTRWFKYDWDWFVCKQAALRSSCATLREWSHNLHPPSCSG